MIKLLSKPNLLALAISSLSMHTVHGADFHFGNNDDISLQVNSQLSVGASWRTENMDAGLIGESNGGTTVGSSTTTDDGNLNFDKGDSFSQIFKGSHDIQVNMGAFGGFTRFKYWSDQELSSDKQQIGNSANAYEADSNLSDDGFSDNAKFEGVTLLDAYVYSSFLVADSSVDIRLGRQVVSWGESTFIQGGMNSSNPFDVSALRRPGATLKEGILPVGMAFVNVGMSENFSMEAFYQYEWAKTEVDGCGTLFGADFVADGCEGVTIMTAAHAAAFGQADATDTTAWALGFNVNRIADDEAKDEGQFGVAARYFSPTLNDTEFGVYFMNLHSRLPLINGNRTAMPGTIAGTSVIDTSPTGGAFVPSAHPVAGALSVYNPSYQIAFPEDLKFMGLSFATNVAGVALSGEVSFKPDTPIQVNGNHVLAAALTENVAVSPFAQRIIDTEPSGVVKGFDQFDVTQIQVTALQFVDQVLGASRLTLIGEVGLILVDGIEDSNFVYGRDPVFGLGQKGDDGYVTNSSWGYRARAELNYNNLLSGISLKPSFSWAHDVDGYAPAPGAQFTQGSQAFGMSVEASYQQTYAATLAYKTFSGGDFNALSDKDFISLSLAVNY